MATYVKEVETPHVHTNNDSSVGILIAIVALIIFAIILFVLARTYLFTAPTPTVNVPDKINIDVQNP